MKLLLWTLCVVGLGPLSVSAQARPDFSGSWTMDPSRSESAAQGPEIGPVAVTIHQSLTEVRVDTIRNGATETVRYLPVEMKALGAGERVGTFRWDGLNLITNLETAISNQAVTVNEVRSLNPDGTEMTVEVTLVVQHGYTTGGSAVLRSPNAPNSATGKNVFLKAR